MNWINYSTTTGIGKRFDRELYSNFRRRRTKKLKRIKARRSKSIKSIS